MICWEGIIFIPAICTNKNLFMIFLYYNSRTDDMYVQSAQSKRGQCTNPASVKLKRIFENSAKPAKRNQIYISILYFFCLRWKYQCAIGQVSKDIIAVVPNFQILCTYSFVLHLFMFVKEEGKKLKSAHIVTPIPF